MGSSTNRQSIGDLARVPNSETFLNFRERPKSVSADGFAQRPQYPLWIQNGYMGSWPLYFLYFLYFLCITHKKIKPRPEWAYSAVVSGSAPASALC